MSEVWPGPLSKLWFLDATTDLSDGAFQKSLRGLKHKLNFAGINSKLQLASCVCSTWALSPENQKVK